MESRPIHPHILDTALSRPQGTTDSAQNLDIDTPEWSGRAILLVDLDAFFASVEQLDHPSWRGKPVIVGGSPDARGVVSTASYEARIFGVHSAMPSATAKTLCPQAIWTSGHFSRYREVSAQVMNILRDESPHVQQVSIDEAFVDVSPGLLKRDPIAAAKRIQKRVAELGITCSIGLGPSKAVAKVASDQLKPHGLVIVRPNDAASFLAPLPTSVMSGIGPVAQAQLKLFNITTLGEVAAAEESVLTKVFGTSAKKIRDRCKGSDIDPVVIDSKAKSISNEMSFAQDLATRDDIEAALATVAAKVGRRLRMQKLHGSTLTLKVRLGDFTIHTTQRQLDEATDDEYVLSPLLFEMLDCLWHEGQTVRLVGCAVSKFTHEAYHQTSLFEDIQTELQSDETQDVKHTIRERLKQQEVRENLTRATDTIRNRFGEESLRFGHELRTYNNLTGSSSKNPADYKSAAPE